jgi:asparagine synthase (glutamine-hydrolysing)
MTRQHVTVALSGDGGDELFGGYSWYAGVGTADRASRHGPALLRRALGSVLRGIPDPPPDFLARMITGGDSANGDRPANALTSLGAALTASGPQASYMTTLAHTVAPGDLLRRDLRHRAGTGTLSGPWLSDTDSASARMLFDAITYMPDDILVKVDRAAMAFSLETRAPLLDHRVFEFAWSVPIRAKLVNGVGKQPLRTLLHRYIPAHLIDRPKRGFAVPLAAWLRGPLKPWADDLLSPASLASSALLDVRRVRRLWSQHETGLADHSRRLWSILSLMAFLRAQSASMAHVRPG